MSEELAIQTQKFSDITLIKNSQSDQLIFILPRVKNWLKILFTIVWTLGWAGGLVFCISILVSERIDLFIVFFMILWLFGGLISTRTFIWDISGKEKITFDELEIKIEKINLLFSKPKIYSIDKVQNFRVGEGSGEGGQFQRDGKIIFDFDGSERRFGVDLTHLGSRFIIETLKKEGKFK